MRITSVPAPFTTAPMAERKFARSTMWGSLAALWMQVVPLADTAVSMLFTVAPTLGISRKMSPPISSSALAMMTPPGVSTSAPRARMPFSVWSMGRRPKSQPPGSGTSARLNTPSSTGAK